MALPSPSPRPLRILVTGGAGFIGSALVRHLMAETPHRVLTVDALTYAGSRAALASHERHAFLHADVTDAAAMAAAFADFRPDAVAHLAAETHVDRSLDAPAAFVRTNLGGTHALLAAALAHWRGLEGEERARFRFLHCSTDEVFGSAGEAARFDEASGFDPRSPYAATKAGADHLVRAWGHSFGLPVLTTHGSNTYGPFQFPEKMIPLMIARAISGAPLPVYGDGGQVRDWLFVEDHARALAAVLARGVPGARYLVGGGEERRNVAVVEALCALLDRLRPRADGRAHAGAIAFVSDRPGHDRRYALDTTRIRAELGWAPRTTFASGLERTVRWFLENEGWWRGAAAAGATERRGLAER